MKKLNGITTSMLGEKILINVNVWKATYRGVPFMNLTSEEKKNYDDMLYLAHVQTGNPQIIYS